ncbi:hypothetical protein ACIOK4_42115 [Streptomyces bottropensis]|uniref:hypothetical protein n=1 Tax=Streptomyces bottropensis TaxID=42235 RepID=UPI0037A98EB2
MSDKQRAVVLRIPRASATTAVVSTGSATLVASGTVTADPSLTWPLVILALGSMGYDLGVRALRRRNK